ncbi:MAG: class I SAM-dependent methyltransferase, partial [Clostridia bacterium]|nr:class I SAM-dependent methyltransferase [Clostridia bacterium]
MKFGYAHMNTAAGERKTPTAQFNRPSVNEKISALRQSAFARQIPTADAETLNFLLTFLAAYHPENILELGTAIGISGAAMLDICKTAHLTTVERDPAFFAEAYKNFSELGFNERVTQIAGDAGEVIETFQTPFDFIFL